MKRAALAFTLTLVPALIPALALAAPDGQQIVLHGNDNGAMPCASCHGADGAGNASMGAPALAGLPAAVIVAKLKNYAAGNGNQTMQYIAKALSPDEMTAVAGYFSGLKKP